MTKVELESRTKGQELQWNFQTALSETEIYNLQGNQILKKSIHCLILKNNRENILKIHKIEGENKENKGERKDCLSPN